MQTDLAALQCFGRVGRGDGGVELVLGFTQQGDHVTVGAVAVSHHLVGLDSLVQDVAEVRALWVKEETRGEVREDWSEGRMRTMVNRERKQTGNVYKCVCVYLREEACTGLQTGFCSSAG